MKTAEEILRECTGHAHGLMDAGTIRAMKAYAMQECIKTLHSAIDDLDLRPLSKERKEQIIFKILSTPI